MFTLEMELSAFNSSVQQAICNFNSLPKNYLKVTGIIVCKKHENDRYSQSA